MALTMSGTSGVLNYPKTRRTNHITHYHGTPVADPYRWLEQDVRQSAEVAEWVRAQNEVTFAYLASLPTRKSLRNRLTALWDYERFSAPKKVGERYFYLKNQGLQNQPVLYTINSFSDEPRVLLDPNLWSTDGTVALTGFVPSDNGKYLAYGTAKSGSDWRTWHVLKIDTGQQLVDKLKWMKFSHVSWTKDHRGFFYSGYDAPTSGTEHQGLNLNQKLYFHRIGTPQSEDLLVYHQPEKPDWGFHGKVTEDGRYLVITVWKGTDEKYRVLVKQLDSPDAVFRQVIDHFENEYTLIGNDGPKFYFQTDLDAPKRRVISIDIRSPQALPEEVIPAAPETLLQVTLLDGKFVVSYLKDAMTDVKILTKDGTLIRDMHLPAIGSLSGFHGRSTDRETFYTFSSFTVPPIIYRYDLPTGKSTLFRQSKVSFNPDDYEVKQIFFHSKDGTRVPMFIAHRKGLKLNRSNPTLLYGYGGFNVSLSPYFSVSRLAWMELGGVLAVANLRGGGEYGEAWHQAGTKLNKQNVFDDFIAAAEWLIDTGYTQPTKLAIQGGSNGGLLVGATMTQRPDLFAVCLPDVGVMDMMRFHEFTAGRFWTDEFGSPENLQQFQTLLAYSPYHNIQEGVSYPATLITTADTDDRVVPAHSFKFAAALQHAQNSAKPVLIRVETRAGHGTGKPTAKVIEEIADQWAFLVTNLQMAPEEENSGDK